MHLSVFMYPFATQEQLIEYIWTLCYDARITTLDALLQKCFPKSKKQRLANPSVILLKLLQHGANTTSEPALQRRISFNVNLGSFSSLMYSLYIYNIYNYMRYAFLYLRIYMRCGHNPAATLSG